MNILFIMLLLWILPALVLAPLLAWAVLKSDMKPEIDPAELKDDVQAKAQDQPEQAGERQQTEQTLASKPAAVDILAENHANSYT